MHCNKRALFDHLVGASDQPSRYFETKCLRGSLVHHQQVFGRVATAAHADIVPGEEIERPDGMLETVVKFDAGKEKVCMRPYAAKECVWRNTEVKRWIALPIGQLCGPQRRLKRAKATPLRDPSP